MSIAQSEYVVTATKSRREKTHQKTNAGVGGKGTKKGGFKGKEHWKTRKVSKGRNKKQQ